ncbi:septum formation protein [Desulfurobacterium pacificum]|uniref:dTTP/UTP pyrophosphatase n=1 Tax=Desulfurobacterium pacificum TaxID=240166 RepID=A0ABY1NCC5_9BACT|nr:nucleoside triphosphate pyrophosphatase [Desulfurobacterium pacificum]SMP05505.1 septum formation protein [Desulfurobacterium pacificum]
MIDRFKILLASSSPRRKEILQMVGVGVRIFPSDAEEKIYPTPEETAVRNAELKALTVKDKAKPDEIILAADTIVVFNGKVLGKPSNKQEAIEFLKKLSSNYHTVITGFALFFPNGKLVSGLEKTEVKFKRMSLKEIEWYVETGEPMDKAGAYGIQGIGAIFIERIEGDYFNVMGLPIGKIYDILTLETKLL